MVKKTAIDSKEERGLTLSQYSPDKPCKGACLASMPTRRRLDPQLYPTVKESYYRRLDGR